MTELSRDHDRRVLVADSIEPDVGSVVAGLGRRRAPLVLGGVVLLILVAMTLAVLASRGFGSQAASATVAGLEYTVSVARSLHVPAELVSEFGTATRIDGDLDMSGSHVYAIDGISPELVLLVKVNPGARDDFGPLGDYAVLVRGSGFEELCPYYDLSSEATPTVCR